MKKIKIALTVLAFAAGIGGAFASKIHIGNGTAMYYVLSPGVADPSAPVGSGGANCTSDPDQTCAQEFNLDAQNQPTTPTGNNIIKGDRND